jgi:hypothetical protein
MNTYTVFCVNPGDPKTIWINAVCAATLRGAIKEGLRQCASDWSCSARSIHVLGVAEGDVNILHWDDLK